MKVRNIIWDTYDPSEEPVSQEELDLPSEVEIPEDVVATFENEDDYIGWLSDEYGFCIISCNYGEEPESGKYLIDICCSWDDAGSEVPVDGETVDAAWRKVQDLMLDEARIEVFEKGLSCSMSVNKQEMFGEIVYDDGSTCRYTITEQPSSEDAYYEKLL